MPLTDYDDDVDLCSRSSQEVIEGSSSSTSLPQTAMDLDEEGEVLFPLTELSHLDEMINRPRWVVPVLHKGELEILLDASINLCKKGQSIN